MYTVKIDKRGKILIPHSVRKSLGLFPGQKMRMDFHGRNNYSDKEKITITPFEYKCRWCGAEIPEGKEYGSCEECCKKNTRKIY